MTFLFMVSTCDWFDNKRKNWKSRQTGDAIEPMVGCSPYILIMLFAWHSEL